MYKKYKNTDYYIGPYRKAAGEIPAYMNEDHEFKFLLEKIRRNKKIDFSGYRRENLIRRIVYRMGIAGCSTYLEYVLLLNRDPEEYDRLIQSLTIKVSHFFRDGDVFRLLHSSVIPGITEQKTEGGGARIRAWSCGAAFGQEAYSMAILFCEALGPRIGEVDIRITATDIDRKALEQAQWASYPRESMMKMEPYLLFKYFSRLNGGYVVSDRARELVSFIHHDILSDRPLNDMDLIMCRNLLIYFEKGIQERVLENLCSSLRRGGFLVLGMTESLGPGVSDRFEAVDRMLRIYRKR